MVLDIPDAMGEAVLMVIMLELELFVLEPELDIELDIEWLELDPDIVL